ncbi:MAG: RCC1 domain-containing protein [bacterium]
MFRAHRSRSTVLVSIACLTLAGLAGCGDPPAAPKPTPTVAQKDVSLPPDPTPIKIVWDDWKSVSAGGDHSCGVTVGGKVYCWGSNSVGQLGSSGGKALRPRAIDLSSTPGGPLTFISVSAGEDHTCGVTGWSAGPIYCWGNGIGATPTALPLGLTFTQVSVGTFEACAITPLGYAYCWTLGGSPSPVSTAPLSLTFTSISVGYDHKCAIAKYTAKAYCWGASDFGQLGVNSNWFKNQPTEVVSPIGNGRFQALAWYSVDAGKQFSCGIQRPVLFGLARGANCWGKGDPGQIGNGLTLGSYVPEAVFDPPGSALDTVSAGGLHACAIELTNNNHGDAWCWGDNHNSQLGDPAAPTAVSVPNRVSGLYVYKQISAGRDHTCALSQYKRADNVAGATPASAVIQCWGLNSHGQLGNTLKTSSSTPVTAIHPQQKYVIIVP